MCLLRSMRAPDADELGGRLDVGREEPVRARAVDLLPQDRDGGAGGGGRLERRPQLHAAGRGHDLDREHPGQPLHRASQLARRRPAHRHVVLLHRARRDGVDAGRRREPLELADDRGLGVLGDHQARSRRRGRRRGTAAGRGCGWRRGSGRCVARSCSPRRRPRSRGSRARTPAGRRGSCRATPAGRRRARTGCRSRPRARARPRSPRGRRCRARPRAPAGRSAASTRPARGRRRTGGWRRSASRRAAPPCARPTSPGPDAGAAPAGRGRGRGRCPSAPRC